MEVLGEHAEATNQAAAANVELPLDPEDETRFLAGLEPTTKGASGAIDQPVSVIKVETEVIKDDSAIIIQHSRDASEESGVDLVGTKVSTDIISSDTYVAIETTIARLEGEEKERELEEGEERVRVVRVVLEEGYMGKKSFEVWARDWHAGMRTCTCDREVTTSCAPMEWVDFRREIGMAGKEIIEDEREEEAGKEILEGEERDDECGGCVQEERRGCCSSCCYCCRSSCHEVGVSEGEGCSSLGEGGRERESGARRCWTRER